MAQRRVLDRESLEKNGITFNESVMKPEEVGEVLGDEAEMLAEQLLDFQRFAPQDRVEPLRRSEFRSLTSRIRAEIPDRKQQQHLIVNGKLRRKAVEANKKALDIVARTEERWMELVKETLFKEIKTRARETEGADILKPAQVKRWLRLEGNDIWEASRDVLASTTPSSAPALTSPKPDLYISLPILRRKRIAKKHQDRDYLRSLFLGDLRRLEIHAGLVACPLKALGEKGPVDVRYRLCFPGFILEAKHHLASRSNRVRAYCQAANAAANALALLHNLVTGSHVNCPADEDEYDDRPVVALTLVGHKARLWLAGTTSEKKKLERFDGLRGQAPRKYIRVKYHMQCIWRGDLHHEEPTTQLVCIIDELEKWMIDDFCPWVSNRIYYYEDADQWGSLQDEETDSEESGTGSSSDDDEPADEDEKEDSDDNWTPSGSDSELESSGLDSDDEDYLEYKRDFDRVDSLLEQLSLKPNAKVSHRFMRVGSDQDLSDSS